MTNDKSSFILYQNFSKQFELLSMEDRGVLITAIFEYHETGAVLRELPPVVGMAFSFIKDTMDRDREAYRQTCARNAENGKKGGRPRKNEAQPSQDFLSEKTEGFFEKPKKADNDNENENDNDNDIDIDNGNEPKSAQRAARGKKVRSYDLDDFFQAAVNRTEKALDSP